VIIFLCVLFGISEFWLKTSILVILDSGVFWSFGGKGKIVILLRGLFLVFYVGKIIFTKFLMSEVIN